MGTVTLFGATACPAGFRLVGAGFAYYANLGTVSALTDGVCWATPPAVPPGATPTSFAPVGPCVVCVAR